MKIVQLTREGLEKLQSELKELTEVKKPYAIERLQKARSMGDLSENSEYSAAKEELALVEGRIQEIDELLKNVEIIQNHTKGQIVALGTKIKVEVNSHTEEFHIVGEFEADPAMKKLSNTSPIGKALIGKTIGDVVEVDVPAGKIKYKIVDIS